MKIIITAAGMGSRFLDVGINVPKYLIKANKKTLLEHSLSTLSNLFDEEFIFIFRNLENEKEIRKIIESCTNDNGKRIEKYKIININILTKGQAETVLFAKQYLENNDSILIYNIDTFVKNGNKHISKKNFENVDGAIFTTKAPGEHWSFAKTENNSNKVIQVTEKIKISDHASIGLYYFKNFSVYEEIIKKFGQKIIQDYKELYIMPIYQYMIDQKMNVVISDVPYRDFIPLGTPSEIFNFDNKFMSENKNV